MKLLKQAKKLPNRPGVYLFLDKEDIILYIGKATSLRKRVLSYFQKNLDPRIREMLNSSRKIKYRKTDSVLEAIILEANLIKKYWPKYNIKEKDNRSFIYIVIPKNDGSISLTASYPRPYLVRYRELQKFLPASCIFGPYQNLSLIKTGLRLIRKIFPYSTCRINSGKPCFDYQIGLCPGACVGKISKDDYKKNIANIILFLEGEKKKLLKKLKKENPSAIQSLKHIQDVALISREEIGPVFFSRIEGYDISQRFNHPEWLMPNLILIDGGKPQIDYISKVLKKQNIAIPLIGISKFAGPPAWTSSMRSRAGDKLVFPPKIKRSLKELIQSSKAVLLKVRNEAHRFALKSSRRQRKIMLK